jgi:hypothetical protein
MPEILYNSQAIKAKIRTLLANSSSRDRRVVLVAYIGKDYAKFLPDPEGIEIICNPTAGATSVAAVDDLMKKTASVYFSDKLHMKVYWSKSRGCLFTSANLSTNALGVRGLKEAGVFVKAGMVNVDKLIAEAQAYAVKDEHIEKLRLGEERHRRALAAAGMADEGNGFQYLDWFTHSVSARTPWKVGDYIGDMEVPEAAKDILKTSYNRNEPTNYLGVTKKHLVRERDWILQFEYEYGTTRQARKLEWMTVDFVCPSSDEPFIAVQAHSLAKYERPPFPLTPQFKAAFQSAVSKSKGKFVKAGSLSPSEAFLKMIAAELNALD